MTTSFTSALGAELKAMRDGGNLSVWGRIGRQLRPRRNAGCIYAIFMALQNAPPWPTARSVEHIAQRLEYMPCTVSAALEAFEREGITQGGNIDPEWLDAPLPVSLTVPDAQPDAGFRKPDARTAKPDASSPEPDAQKGLSQKPSAIRNRRKYWKDKELRAVASENLTGVRFPVNVRKNLYEKRKPALQGEAAPSARATLSGSEPLEDPSSAMTPGQWIKFNWVQARLKEAEHQLPSQHA